MILIIGSIII